MTALTADDVRTLFSALTATINGEREHLIELDSAIGDGDLGITMSRGFTEADTAIRDGDDNDPGRVFMKAGMTIARIAPSTMGTLVATGFMKGGKAVAGNESLALPDLTEFFDAFVTGIMDRGGAKPGDKTIVDALLPVVESLRKSEISEASLKEALQSASHAALAGAEKARGMIAVHGRPAYYGDKSKGMDDPGAYVGTLIVKAFADHVK